MNKITATGRIAADAELKYTPAGDPILEFRLASDVGYGDKKTTNWFRCSIFGKRGEALAPHLAKGQQVTAFGSLTLREWQNKEGQKQISPEIRIDEIELQGNKQQSSDQAKPEAKPRSAKVGQKFDDTDSDVPF